MKRSVIVLAMAFAALAASAARAQEQVERFLPDTTLMYGGVTKLGAGFDKVIGLLQRTLPFAADELSEQRIIGLLARAFELQGVQTRADFLAQTGLDPEGSAGIAWVLSDPSYDPFRSANENVLLILPVKDAARAERLLAARLLPELLRGSANICRANTNRLQDAKQAWKRANPNAPAAPLTWADLAAANPGLKPLLCPAGGEYTLGKPDEQASCSFHSREVAPPPMDFSREGLGTRAVGDVTLVGGTSKGTGYAVTATHLIISNHMVVLEAAAKAAAGAGPRAKLAQPAAAGGMMALPGVATCDGRIYLNASHLMYEVRREVDRWARRRPSPFAAQALALLDAPGGVTGDVRLTEPIAVSLTADIAASAATQALLATAPGKLEALGLVPDTALAAWAGNIAPVVFNIIGDFASLDEPAVGGSVKILGSACSGDGVFAFTKGSFQGEVPHMLLILGIRDPGLMQGVLQMWVGILSKEMRAEGFERSQVGGIEVTTMKLRREGAMHYAIAGPFLIGGTNLEDVKAAIELQAGRGRNSLLASDRFRRLELPEGPTTLLSFLDMPAFVGQMEAGQRERQIFWQNERCRLNLERVQQLVQAFQADRKRFPASFDELRQFAQQKGQGQVNDWCMVFGQDVKLTLDPQAGVVTCPRHGTLANFKPVTPEEPVRVSKDVLFLSAFGLSGVRLRVEGAGLKGEGRLIPVPQTLERQGHL